MTYEERRTTYDNEESALSDLTSKCIRCGFCLEACPTFVLTGHETESPRGRIYLTRSADEGKIFWEDARVHLDRCLGCRACEPACPSGVEYGKILELARQTLEAKNKHRTKSALLSGLTSPTRLTWQLKLGKLWPGKRIPGFLSRLLSREAPEAEKPRAQPSSLWPPLEEEKLPPVKGEVYLLEGCAMRVLYPRVHEATRRLLRRIGYTVKPSNAECCGALHAHNGYLSKAIEMAERAADEMKENLPLIVNSAGCGSFLKDHSTLSTRTYDASEFLFENGLVEKLAKTSGFSRKVTYHDACHLAHGQRVRGEPRGLLQAIPCIEFVELNEADQCCGSAGIYNLLQPKLARALLQRKWAHIKTTGAEIVALGNPGCHAWIEQASREMHSTVRVLHTMEVLEAAFSGIPPN